MLTLPINPEQKNFFSLIVAPINNVEEGYAAGKYRTKDRHLTTDTVPLKNAEGEKLVFFIPYSYASSLREHGLQFCAHSPNYLLGFMKQMSKQEMPTELKGRVLIAMNPEDRSLLFLHGKDRLCWLAVKQERLRRELSLIPVEEKSDESLILAEKI